MRFIETLLGVDLSGWEDSSGWRLDWSNLPSAGDARFLLLLLGGAVLAGLIWLYRKDAAGSSRLTRGGLIALRFCVATALAVALLEPVLVLERSEDLPTNLIVLRDVSASMDLSDSYDDPRVASDIARKLELGSPEALAKESRSSLVDRVYERGLLESLEADGDRRVRAHDFADRLVIEEGDLADREAAKQFTAIGSAVEQAMAAYRGQPLAGVLLVSDGRSNAGVDPLRSAELARGDRVPIHVLATGRDAESKNLALTRIDVDPFVFVRDPIELRIAWEMRGYPDDAASILVERRVDGGDWDELDRRDIDFAESGQVGELAFQDRHDRAAEIEYRATIDSLPSETSPDDNVAAAKVQVVRQQMRVLLVAGLAFPEVQFMINTLLRDPAVELSSWLMFADSEYEQKGDKKIRRLPSTQEELDKYDCVVLYDTDLRELPRGFGQMLQRFVGRAGGGLVYIAGEASTQDLFDRKLPGSDELISLLPVIRNAGMFRTRIEQRLGATTEWKPRVTPEGLSDPIFRFTEDPVKNERILASLPGMYWHFPVSRAKPGATVLARHGDARMSNQYGQHVVFATQLYGPGRTIFVALDSTYRWRYLEEQHFDGFWARVVDRAGRSKRLGGRMPFVLSSDRRSYAPGAVATIEARFRSPEERDPGLQALAGQVECGDDEVQPILLTPNPQNPDLFEAQYRVTRSGDHFVRVWPSDEALDGVRAATIDFDVELPNRELSEPALDGVTLGAMAASTGGEVFGLQDFDRIADAFDLRRITRVQRTRQELWDAPLIFGLLFLFLFAEWVLRKRHRMV